MKRVIVLAIVAGVLAGCATTNDTKDINKQNVIVQKVDKDDLREIIKKEKMTAEFLGDTQSIFSAIGEGVPPMNTVSPAQARALAKRAAIADGYRQLASKLYGVKINAKDTVKDAMLQSSIVESRVSGLIKDASITNSDFKDGLYRVEMELKIDQDKWKELFAY